MKFNVYSYYDSVGECFGQMMQSALSEDQQIEMAQRAVKGDTQQKFRDLTLYKIGTFDDATGKFDAQLKKLLDLYPRQNDAEKEQI